MVISVPATGQPCDLRPVTALVQPVFPSNWEDLVPSLHELMGLRRGWHK